MLAMQYEISLPADYDMAIIRDRIATRGHALDDYPGLGLKAYLVRDVGTGSAVNAYAPLYLWVDDAAAGRFLWGGDGFGGIVRDFGRPTVRTWLGGDHRPGPAHDTSPRRAVRTTSRLAPDVDPLVTAADAAALTDALLDGDDVHSVSWAIDPASWELMVLIVHTTAEPAPPGDRDRADTVSYEVLHLSVPGIHDLP